MTTSYEITLTPLKGAYNIRESELGSLGKDIAVCSNHRRTIVVKSIAITTLLIRIQVNSTTELSACINEIMTSVEFP